MRENLASPSRPNNPEPGLAPGPDAARDAADLDISYAAKSPDAPKPRWRDQAGVLIPLYAAMLFGFPFVWLLAALPIRLPPVLWIALIPLVVFAIFAGRRHQGLDRLPKLADPARRIHVLRVPPRLLKRFGPLRDEAFEPEAVHDPMPLPDRWWDWLGIIALMIACGYIASKIPGMRGPSLALGGVGAGGAFGMAALGIFRQTWLRFSPGRLDVMVFRPWKPDAIRVQTYDLRTPRVVIDLRWRRLILGQGKQATTISLGSMFTVTRTWHLALQAAASTAPTPNLPPTRLTD